MEPDHTLQKNIGITFSVIVMIGVFFVTIFFGKKSPDVSTAINNTQTTSPNRSVKTVSTPKSTQVPPVDTKKSVLIYKNGTYSAIGSYFSPGGEDQLAVTLVLKNDLITDVSVTPQAGDRTSERYQNMFIADYKQYVVGKNIADVYLTKISGSSLTPQGFDDALAQIKSQAQV
jgi:hypothetical protein